VSGEIEIGIVPMSFRVGTSHTGDRNVYLAVGSPASKQDIQIGRMDPGWARLVVDALNHYCNGQHDVVARPPSGKAN
jgi:hypothetical protein